jgi:hypothetical protein
VGLLWTNDQSDAQNYTWQHTTLTRDRHPRPGGIRTGNPRKREAADQRLERRGHSDQTYVRVFSLFLHDDGFYSAADHVFIQTRQII